MKKEKITLINSIVKNEDSFVNKMKQMVTRFAPSPTGALHLGGARTALFNWLQARASGGKFLIRIEDTDAVRSEDAFVKNILESLEWLGLTPDDDPLFQSSRLERHREAALKLIDEGKAYYCYTTPEELDAMREEAKIAKRPFRYDGKWRDRTDTIENINPVIRVKAPQTGTVRIDDRVQGTVEIDATQIDDFVLLRADGSPTYMLSVVVDDFDQSVTDIIRGDDHFTNAFRHKILFEACGFPVPAFAHLPLLHSTDGQKLSKRHGAPGIEQLKEDGYMAEAVVNFLLRLGWGKGTEEIIAIDSVPSLFDISDLGRAPSKLDFDKLNHMNAHYMRNTAPQQALEILTGFLYPGEKKGPEGRGLAVLKKALPAILERSHSWVKAAHIARIYLERPNHPLQDEKAAKALDSEGKAYIKKLYDDLALLEDWSAESFSTCLKIRVEKEGCKFGVVARPVRAALAGIMQSPDLAEMAEAFGREESLARLKSASEK